MGSLDANKEEFIAQLLDGNWKSLFPADTWKNLSEWFSRQTDQKQLSVRFTFFDPEQNFQKFAIHILCSPLIKKNKVEVKNLFLPQNDDNPLGIPPSLYDTPLYSMPNDLLQRSLRKRKKR